MCLYKTTYGEKVMKITSKFIQKAAALSLPLTVSFVTALQFLSVPQALAQNNFSVFADSSNGQNKLSTKAEMKGGGRKQCPPHVPPCQCY